MRPQLASTGSPGCIGRRGAFLPEAAQADESAAFFTMQVLLLMLIRGVCIGLTLSISLQSGTKRGLIGKKGMPEMLRTLISLPPSGEDASFGPTGPSKWPSWRGRSWPPRGLIGLHPKA